MHSTIDLMDDIGILYQVQCRIQELHRLEWLDLFKSMKEEQQRILKWMLECSFINDSKPKTHIKCNKDDIYENMIMMEAATCTLLEWHRTGLHDKSTQKNVWQSLYRNVVYLGINLDKAIKESKKDKKYTARKELASETK